MGVKPEVGEGARPLMGTLPEGVATLFFDPQMMTEKADTA
jgi:hypothetical protein